MPFIPQNLSTAFLRYTIPSLILTYRLAFSHVLNTYEDTKSLKPQRHLRGLSRRMLIIITRS